ncbi:hypothetical protein FSP39_002254 [Pinctada imbricata]|uniref:MAPEG family protein n=1 Tax=Pinctada imbricata TaxID=66713 RepID=A0AA88XRR1_PINIB|nr:hypothetical protein FSP39_002254 [Pinctada imbricata]
MRSLPEDRHTVYTLGGLGVGIAGLILFLGYFVLSIPVPPVDTLTARLVFTLRWQILPLLTFMVGIERVANTRLKTSAIDPLSGKGEHLVEFYRRYAQNTLEQLCLHIVGQMTLCTFLNLESLTLIPTFAVLFFIGRMVFWFGYRSKPLHRATGFAMTFPVTMLTILYCIFCLFTSGPNFLLQNNIT